jgi:cytochrome c-type biogenesis protein CcmH
MEFRRVWLFWGVLAAGVLLFAGLAAANKVSAHAPVPTQQPVNGISDNDVNRVAKRLYCPVCPNTPLDVCETQACKDWRAQIREQLAAGWTDQQVMDFFAQQYGKRVLAEPERGGFTALVWTLPALVAGIGLALVWLILRSWRASRKNLPAQAEAANVEKTAIPRDVLAKIEAEIREMD